MYILDVRNVAPFPSIRQALQTLAGQLINSKICLQQFIIVNVNDHADLLLQH